MTCVNYKKKNTALNKNMYLEYIEKKKNLVACAPNH